MLTMKQVSEILNVHYETLRSWERQGRLIPIRTPGNHRRYDEQQIWSLVGKTEVSTNADVTVVYARVSSHSQKTSGDLGRQIRRLNDYCASHGLPAPKLLYDIGSGINGKRPKFLRLFDLAFNKKYNRLVVENKDRLTRFNFDVYKSILNMLGVTVIVMSNVEKQMYEQELVDDLIALTTSFSAKIYQRTGANRNVQSVQD